MKKLTSITVLSLAAAAVMLVAPRTSQAQCATCVTPHVAYSPVAYNTYAHNTYAYDGWYLGKYLGQATRRVFGVAPAAAYQVGYPTTYAAAYPRTYGVGYRRAYSVGYAPAYSYAALRPALCTSCGTSPCGCTHTTYRPIVMQAVHDCSSCCNTCNSCNTCGTVGQAIYQPSAASNCPTCATSSHAAPAPSAGNLGQPSLPANSSAPPSTFRADKHVHESPAAPTPVPAEESSFEERNADAWDAPLLLDPNDKLTKRPTAPVWAAVYKTPAGAEQTKTRATAKTISQSKSNTKTKRITGWTSGR